MRPSPAEPDTEAEKTITDAEILEHVMKSYFLVMNGKLTGDPQVHDAFRENVAHYLRIGDIETAQRIMCDYFSLGPDGFARDR